MNNQTIDGVPRRICHACVTLARNAYCPVCDDAPAAQHQGQPVAPWFYFVECDDPDYSGLFNHESEAQTQANDHGGVVVKLWNVPPTWRPATPSPAGFWKWLDTAYRDGSKGDDPRFTKYNMEVAYSAGMSAEQPASKPELTVWYGAMPESNGKTNWTAMLHRKDDPWGGITLDRSEYPDRVRYEADRMRYMIGELDIEPFILDYDDKLHSGYKGEQ